MDCIFCKIARHEIPKDFVYEDEEVMVFPDIHPIKPTHLLIIPKQHIPTFSQLDNDIFLSKARKIMQQLIQDTHLEGEGYRIVINGGGAQAVDHVHIHLTGPWGNAANL